MERRSHLRGALRTACRGNVARTDEKRIVESREDRSLDRDRAVLYFLCFPERIPELRAILSRLCAASPHWAFSASAWPFVVIGRGIDLAIVAIYAMSAAWTLHLANNGVSIPVAMLLGYLFALSAGVINGVLIAYVEIPALFATLGMASLVYGFARFALVPALRGLYARERLEHRLDRRRLCVRSADADPVFRAGRFARVRLPAVHQTRAVHLRDRRQFRGGAHFRRAGASDHRPAICAYRRRIAYLAGMITATAVVQHEHQRRQFRR